MHGNHISSITTLLRVLQLLLPPALLPILYALIYKGTNVQECKHRARIEPRTAPLGANRPHQHTTG